MPQLLKKRNIKFRYALTTVTRSRPKNNFPSAAAFPLGHLRDLLIDGRADVVHPTNRQRNANFVPFQRNWKIECFFNRHNDHCESNARKIVEVRCEMIERLWKNRRRQQLVRLGVLAH